MKYKYIAAAIVCVLTFSSCGDSSQDAKSKTPSAENEPSRLSDALAQAPDEEKAYLLCAVAIAGNAEGLSKLLKEGINPNMKFEGVTPLMAACVQGHDSCVKILLEHGADVNARGDDDMTALGLAAVNGRSQCVKLLLAAGANVNERYEDKQSTPLMYACSSGHVECAKILIQAGADVSARGVHGLSVLMHTCFKGKAECVRVLIQAGANVHARADNGMTALDIAVRRGELDCAKLLRAAGAIE